MKERKEEGGGASKMEEGRHERTELTAHHSRGENISSKNIMISSPTKFYVSPLGVCRSERKHISRHKNQAPSSGRAALKATSSYLNDRTGRWSR